MGIKNVSLCSKHRICSGCGVCKHICPRKCIEYVRKDGQYLPSVNEDECVQCGLCTKVCPGIKMTYSHDMSMNANVIGPCVETYNCASKHDHLKHVSASGGVLMTTVKFLLEHDIYDLTFCVSTYSYDEQVKTEEITKGIFQDDWMNQFPKSRYVPVSHEHAVAYMKNNRDKKVILIGTSCAIRAFKTFIHSMHLNADNYLLLGLFCDSTFNYNIYQYFDDAFGDHQLAALHFKNKESGGWPGNMKLFLKDGTTTYVDQEERTNMKPYFMTERCLYCVDKLNVEADISFGDNFTSKAASLLGSNSIIIRSKKGLGAWNLVKEMLEYSEVTIEDVWEAQYMDGRLNHAYFAVLKEKDINKHEHLSLHLNEGLRLEHNPNEYERAWKIKQRQLEAGSLYLKKPLLLPKEIKKEKKRKNQKSLLSIYERIFYGIKRRVKR